MTWDEAMERYGSDKPDIRFGMELMDISEYVKGSDFKVFKSVLDNGGQVKVIKVDGYANIPRRELDGLVEYAQRYGAKGLAWISTLKQKSKSPFKKFYSEETFQKIKEATNAQAGDLLLVVADKPLVVAQALGELRLKWAVVVVLLTKTNINSFGLLTSLCLNMMKKTNVGKLCIIHSQHHVMKMYNISQLTQVA